MQRRIQKKAHRKHAEDVLLGVLRSSSWRDDIVALEEGQEILLNSATARDRADSASRLIKANNLEFALKRLAPDEDLEKGARLFELTAVHFPSIGALAEEYENSIGDESP